MLKHRTGIMAAAIACGMAAGAAWAGPERRQVVRGDVTFIREGNQLIIHASDGSIINYYSFGIGRGEVMRFIQPSELARVLNRITGPDPTVIAGTLLANGRVYIVNPAGVYFTRGAVVNVGGLYAAAGSITDEQFIASVDRFRDLNGSVINEGSIRADAVHLIGERVANHGSIDAGERGLVAMLAGDDVLIRRHGERITVKIDGKTLSGCDRPLGGRTDPSPDGAAGVENTGTIEASRGTVFLGAGDLYSLAIRNAGRIEAERGSITLAAADGLVHNLGTISAGSGPGAGAAGSVVVQGPSVVNEGEIRADAERGEAGSVEVTSRYHTYLLDGSLVSAAGGAGRADGGTILIHSYDGLTAMTGGARLDLSGGARGGHGGFAEISGDALLFNGWAELSAIRGFRRATLLLDPRTIRIEDVGTSDDLVADGSIHFEEPDALTDITISDEALEALGGHIVLQASRDLRVHQQLDFVNSNDLTLLAAGEITIDLAINGVRDLRVEADVDRSGEGDLFINRPLLDIRGNATFYGASTFLNNPVQGEDAAVATLGTQTYLGPVDLCVDTVLTAAHVSFMHRVDDTLPAQQSLTIHGPAVFGGPVGGLRRLEFLAMRGAAQINGGLVITEGHQLYDGTVQLGADTTMTSTGAGDIRFADAFDGGVDLLVNTAGLTIFDGAGGAARQLESLTTDAPGVTMLGASLTGRRIRILDPAILTRRSLVTGTELVEFGQTVDGGHSLVANSGELVRFGDDVGGAAALAALETNSNGLVIFDGALVRTEGDLRLNPLGRPGVPPAATIGGRGRSLRLESLHGDFVMGLNEKLTALGDLTIAATGGAATLGDLNSPGDVAVESDVIRLRTRAAGLVHDFRGNTLMDRGLDFVAGGRFWFSSAPIVLGSGPRPLFASPRSGSGADAAGTLGEFTIRPYRSFGLRRLLLGDVVLDLRAAPGVTDSADEPPRGDEPRPQNIAVIYPGTVPIGDHVPREPFGMRPMERLAIALRSLTGAELLASTEGREVYDDSGAGGTAASGEAQVISANRLRRESVLAAVERLERMAGPVAVEEPAGDAPPRGAAEVQREHIRQVLGRAWERYRSQRAALEADGPGAADGGAEARGFRAYLASEGSMVEALATVDAIRSLLEELRIMGLAPRELRLSSEALIALVTPEGMDLATARAAIGG